MFCKCANTESVFFSDYTKNHPSESSLYWVVFISTITS